MAILPLPEGGTGTQVTVHKQMLSIFEMIHKKLQKTDTEYLIIVGGKTGSGKSVFSQIASWLVDKTFFGQSGLDRVCFNPVEFSKAIRSSRKQAVICDEAISVLFSRAAMVADNRVTVQLLNQIRQRNLCLFLLVPNPMDLDKSIREKADMYIEIYEYTNNRGQLFKGCADVYPDFRKGNVKLKTAMFHYLELKRRNPIAFIKPPKPFTYWQGDYYKSDKEPNSPINQIEYRKKKESVLDQFEAGELKRTKAMDQRDIVIYRYVKDTDCTIAEAARRFKLPDATIRKAVERYERDNQINSISN